MSTVFVRGSSRAKAYTRATAQHRMVQKVMNKGSHRTRATKAFFRASGMLGEANSTGKSMKRVKQLQKRLQGIQGYLHRSL